MRVATFSLLIVVLTTSAPAAPADRFQNLFFASGQAILQNSERLTLFSLSPHHGPLFSWRRLPPNFHGYPILGSVELTGEAKSELLGKLYTAIAEEASPARCFNPRHGIRATDGGGQIDLVICFECGQVVSYIHGKEGGAILSGSAASHFDKVLQDAKVPLSQDE